MGLNIIPMRYEFVVRSRLKTCEGLNFIFEATKLSLKGDNVMPTGCHHEYVDVNYDGNL